MTTSKHNKHIYTHTYITRGEKEGGVKKRSLGEPIDIYYIFTHATKTEPHLSIQQFKYT